MAKMSVNKTNKGNEFSSWVTETNTNSEATLTHISQNSVISIEASTLAISKLEAEQVNSHLKNINKKDELIKVETKSIFQRLKAKTAAALVGSAVMLPILAVGTATYYFGSQAVNKQTILAKRANIDLAETELARQQKLLAALLIGTGTTALLAGAVAALGTKRLWNAMSKISREETAAEAEARSNRASIDNSSQSDLQKDIVKAIVEEARTYLNCDRAIVYSLDRDKQGVIVAESVAAGYTQALGKTIKEPFEARDLHKYRDEKVKAINALNEVEMTRDHQEQLEELEVKANLVTPIINDGRLFGLLVAHQCSQPRHWQQGELEFLHQLAKKAGLALENAQLLDALVRFQTQAARERKWTHYFSEAIQYIRQSIKQEDILEISVEEVKKVLNCDRVIVYSLNQDNYGVVVAESVTAGYPRAFKQTITDPCFEARYLEKYRDGRVRAINDIYAAGMTQCYIEQLESLEVKANLVTPIVSEGKLFGLLVAHQCSQPRDWQDYEIRWVTQIATQVGFALERVKLREELALAQNSRSNEVDKQQLEQASLNQRSEIINSDLAECQQLNNGEIILQPKNIQLEDNLTTTKPAIAEATDEVEVLKQSHQNLDQMVNLINDLKKEINRPVSQTKPAQLPMREIIVETSERLSRSRLTEFYRPAQQNRPASAGSKSDLPATHDLAWLEDTTTESILTVGEITLSPVNNHTPELDFIQGQLVEKSQSAPSLNLMNQFVGEITNLSEQISQQSLVVTESFQKLATFAKQLSEREKP